MFFEIKKKPKKNNTITYVMNLFIILQMKDDEDKIFPLGKHKLMLAAGEAGDRIQFCEYISKNIALYNLRNGYPFLCT
jgi:20S proteasome alpha/beta subunit